MEGIEDLGCTCCQRDLPISEAIAVPFDGDYTYVCPDCYDGDDMFQIASSEYIANMDPDWPYYLHVFLMSHPLTGAIDWREAS